MKKTLQICLLILGMMTTATAQKVSQSLNSTWQFRQVGQQHWQNASVPGTVHTDLLAAGVIEDPFYRLNEHDQQWIDKVDWEYSKEVKIGEDLLKKQHLILNFEGLDTYATIYWNGETVVETDNMFRTYSLDLKGLAKPVNTLRVVFTSPIDKGMAMLADHGYPLPAINDQSQLGGLGDNKVSIFARKAGYHYGWDWGPRFVTSGIWRNVSLQAWDETSIANVHIRQGARTKSVANLSADLKLTAASSVKARILVDGKLVKEQQIDKETTSIDFVIKKPKLWWPNGMGEAHLYHVSVELWQDQLLEKWETEVGLRTVKWVQEPDADGKGKSFYVEINGKPVFAKGANYIPNDLFLPRVSKETYEHIVLSAKRSNMNMLRVWGGGIYEQDYFYELCDKYGIMVWQDFMFACSMYPGDQQFLDNVKQEAIENVVRLRNHPSIVLWCGNNEIEMAWSEWKENAGWGWKQRYNAKQRKEIWKAYDDMFHHILPDVVNGYTDGDFYWHSSPSAGFEQLATYETKSGDSHYWGVWHGEHPFEQFRQYVPRFMSEYGFQSFPEFNSVKQFTTEEDWDIKREVMASHQRSGIGNLRIRSYMEMYYKVPDNFEQQLYVGQVLQAKSAEMAIDAHRNAMPYCMGTLFWQINDCWPVASWSSIDSYGKWKAMQYKVAEMYQPTIWVTEQKQKQLELALVHDGPEKVTGKWRIQLQDFEGNVVWTRTGKTSLLNNERKVIESIDTEELGKQHDLDSHMLVLELVNSKGQQITARNIYFEHPKELQLPTPDLTWEAEQTEKGIELVLKTDKLAKDVFVSLIDIPEGHFSDNYFDMLPNSSKKIVFEGSVDIETFRSHLKIQHLAETASYGLSRK
ncbi:glycoside hydrolase family 2 protein [Limibacter armeniacum]|uniref:beta-mannosidase n=1 Tax=Limibacter armeniacum TaxID=466084 RepID=UPI002FE5E952